jgi:Tfp pilus assembly protein PilO
MFRTVTPIVSIILAILLFMFFVQPQYDEVKGLRKDRDDYREATTQYDAFNKKLQDKINQKNDFSMSDKERLEEFMPNDLDSSELLVKLEQIVKRHNMLFGNIKADDGAGKELLGRVPQEGDESEENANTEELVSLDISFSVIGTYTQFKDLLVDLESSLTLFEIIDIKLDEGGETQFQQYAITVRAFALQDENN